MTKSDIKKIVKDRYLRYIDTDLKLIDFTVGINKKPGVARVMACHYSKARHVCEKRYFDYIIDDDKVKFADFKII